MAFALKFQTRQLKSSIFNLTSFSSGGFKNTNINFRLMVHQNAYNTTEASKIKKDELGPFVTDDKHVWTGPAHPVSNMRQKVFPSSESLNEAEKIFYQAYKETDEWNQNHWIKHNKEFEEAKKQYIEKASKRTQVKDGTPLTSKEMSLFYKQFLDENWQKHVSYNWEWYKRNFCLLFLAVKMNISRLKRHLGKKT